MIKTFFEILLFLPMVFLPSCTLSFQNISTHGTATDLVDEDQKTDSNPAIQLPNL